MAIETLEVRMLGKSSDFTKDLDKAEKGFGNFKSVVSGMAMGVGIAVAGMAVQAGQALLQFGADSVGAASDLQETLSKSEVLFGENAASVQAWADSAALAFGQSTQTALDAAATFATFGRAAGLTGQELETFSTGFVELSSDLASFNNTSPEQAIQAIGAALRGESEPLRAYGVLLDDASMRQKALELGLISTTKEALTPQQKVLAAQALIYEQTSAAQGDFARTSEGLANQQRIATAQMENMKATLGQALLPVVLAFTSVLNELVTAVLPPVSEFIKGQVVPAMEQLAGLIRSTVGPALAAMAGDFGGLGGGMAAVTSGPFAGFVRAVGEYLPQVQAAFQRFVDAVLAFWNMWGDEIMFVVGTTMEWLARYTGTMMQTIVDIVTLALQLLTGDWEGAGETLQGILQRWREFFTSAITGIIDFIRSAFQNVDWGGIGRAMIEGIANGLRNAAGWLRDAAWNAAMDALRAAQNALGIHSPSTVAAEEIGAPFAEGIGVGMERALGALTRSMDGMLAGMVGGLSVPEMAPAGAGASISIMQQFYGQADGPMVRGAAQDGVLAALRAAGLTG